MPELQQKIFFATTLNRGFGNSPVIPEYGGENVDDIIDGACLIHAVNKNHVKFVAYLLSLPIKIDIQDENGNTALHWAAHKGYLEMVKRLVNHGARCTMKNNRGHTPEQEALLGEGP